MSGSRLRILAIAFVVLSAAILAAEKPKGLPKDLEKAFVGGSAAGFKQLTWDDFENVNCDKDTWADGKDGLIRCTGQPVGVCRSKKQLTNFELVLEWRHEKFAGNSGVFVWTPMEAIKKLKPGALPSGIEVQVLDNGYTEQYEKSSKKKATWFTTHGDVFPVGKSKMKPFKPTSPDGSRSFPKKNLSKSAGEWNHYYIRAVDGEIRLWVNGEEVSGGSDCDPKSGYLCLEAEGTPIDFRNIYLRELP